MEYVLPEEIEKRSFEIIGAELAERGIVLPKDQEAVTKRAIHTTADFEYARTLMYSENAVEIAKKLILSGAVFVTDTNMAKSGINKKILAKFGGEVHCFVAEPDVAAEAKQRGVTRSTVSMERAAKLHVPLIFAIGNAPTALIQLEKMIAAGQLHPELIVGVPVGFVNVVESKERIMQAGVPYIVAWGRKGGSNVAASIINALLYQLVQREGF